MSAAERLEFDPSGDAGARDRAVERRMVPPLRARFGVTERRSGARTLTMTVATESP